VQRLWNDRWLWQACAARKGLIVFSYHSILGGMERLACWSVTLMGSRSFESRVLAAIFIGPEETA
jgi:hypothetical protein